MGRADQPAIDRIRPRVVRAGDPRLGARAALLAQPRAAMTTHVGMGVGEAVAVLDHEHTLAGDIGDEPVTGRQAIVAADVEPRPVEDAFPFAIEHLA